MMCRGSATDQLQVRNYLPAAAKEHWDCICADLVIACDVAAVPYADAYAALVQTLLDNCSNQTVVLLGYQVQLLNRKHPNP